MWSLSGKKGASYAPNVMYIYGIQCDLIQTKSPETLKDKKTTQFYKYT